MENHLNDHKVKMRTLGIYSYAVYDAALAASTYLFVLIFNSYIPVFELTDPINVTTSGK